MIWTWIWIPPLYWMTDYLEENGFKHKVNLIFWASYENDLVNFKKYSNWSKEYKNFNFYTSVSRVNNNVCVKDMPYYCTSRTPDIINHLDIDFEKQIVYLCGSPIVIKDLQKLLIKLWVKEKNMFSEMF